MHTASAFRSLSRLRMSLKPADSVPSWKLSFAQASESGPPISWTDLHANPSSPPHLPLTLPPRPAPRPCLSFSDDIGHFLGPRSAHSHFSSLREVLFWPISPRNGNGDCPRLLLPTGPCLNCPLNQDAGLWIIVCGRCSVGPLRGLAAGSAFCSCRGFSSPVLGAAHRGPLWGCPVPLWGVGGAGLREARLAAFNGASAQSTRLRLRR